MSVGRHAAEFTFVGPEVARCDVMVGLARPGINVHEPKAHRSELFWGLSIAWGTLVHGTGRADNWAGRQEFGAGDIIVLLLDCDTGTLTDNKHGVRLGVALTGLTGNFSWAAAMAGSHQITIAEADPEPF